jgi:hypothetical protein
MKIIRTLVKQIGGELRTGCGDHDQGAGFTVTFSIRPPPEAVANGASVADKRSVEQAMKVAAE